MSTPALTGLRDAVHALAVAAAPLPDAAMDAPYTWGDYNEEGLRFALLTAYHDLTDLGVRLRGLAPPPTQARLILAGFIDAHADLAGLLVSASDPEMDLAPAEGQWPLRAAIDHVLGSENGFTYICRRGLERVREGRPQSEYTNADWGAIPRAGPALGGRDAVLARLQESRDAVLDAFADLPDALLDQPIRFWEQELYPLRFRLIRYELHLRQHIIQADKTMAGIGHPPAEAERLVRLIYRGLGAVEAALLGAEDGAGAGAIAQAAAAITALGESFAPFRA